MRFFCNVLICACMYVYKCACVYAYESLLACACLCLGPWWILVESMTFIHITIKLFPTALNCLIFSSQGTEQKAGNICYLARLRHTLLTCISCQIIGAHGSVWVGRSFTELTVNCSCKAKDTIWLWLRCPVLLTCKGLAKIMACQVQFSYRPLTP